METFISWSGPRSKAVAEAIRQWLPKVIQSARPWMSGEDISAGARWLTDVSGTLNNAKVGIICVTPENQHNPWLLFEAGALSKTLEQTKVCPLTFDMTPGQIKGPLSQFQGNELNRLGVGRVLKTINEGLDPGREISPAELDEIIDVWWPKLEERLKQVPPVPVPTPVRSIDDQLEELLMLSREQIRRENLRLEASKERDEKSEKLLDLMESAGLVMHRVDSNAKTMQGLLKQLHGAMDGTEGDVEIQQQFQELKQIAGGMLNSMPSANSLNVAGVAQMLRELHESGRLHVEEMLKPQQLETNAASGNAVDENNGDS
jgi:hypothetical protein